MPSVFQVEYESLQQVADNFQTQSETADTILSNIVYALQRLENGGWIGRGSHAFFYEMHNEVIPAFTRLSHALAEGSRATNTIIGIAHAAEEEASAPFRTGGDALPNMTGGNGGGAANGASGGMAAAKGAAAGAGAAGGAAGDGKMIGKKVSAKVSYFDKKNLLPKFTHVPEMRRDSKGRFAPGKNGKFAPVAPGFYSRYGGKEVARTFKTNGSADPRDWTSTRNSKPKDGSSKFGTNFMVAGGDNQLLGAQGSAAGGALSGRYGVWENHSAGFRADGDGLKAQAAVELRAGVEGSAKHVFFDGQPVKVEAKGTVFAGGIANANAEATFTKERVALSGQASAFLGGEVKGSLKAIGTVNGHEIGNVEATAGVTAGIGGQAEATASYQDGKIRLAAGGKFAVGVGLSFKVDTTIDVKQSYQAAKEEVGKVMDYAEKNRDKIISFMRSVVP